MSRSVVTAVTPVVTLHQHGLRCNGYCHHCHHLYACTHPRNSVGPWVSSDSWGNWDLVVTGGDVVTPGRGKRGIASHQTRSTSASRNPAPGLPPVLRLRLEKSASRYSSPSHSGARIEGVTTPQHSGSPSRRSIDAIQHDSCRIVATGALESRRRKVASDLGKQFRRVAGGVV